MLSLYDRRMMMTMMVRMMVRAVRSHTRCLLRWVVLGWCGWITITVAIISMVRTVGLLLLLVIEIAGMLYRTLPHLLLITWVLLCLVTRYVVILLLGKRPMVILLVLMYMLMPLRLLLLLLLWLVLMRLRLRLWLCLLMLMRM